MSVTLITGCSSGFGLGAAVALAKRGGTVVATMRNTAKAGPLRKAAGAAGVDVVVAPLDVTDSSSRARAVAEVVARYGQIDVLINNAGLCSIGASEMLGEDNLRDQFETNVFAVYALTAAVLPGMRARRSGRIVNVSSVAAFFAPKYMMAYAATKHALDALSAEMDLELKEFNVRVTSVAPVGFGTALSSNVPPPPVEPVYGDGPRKSYDDWVALLGKRSDISPVVDAIVDAATTPNPRLRYLVKASPTPLPFESIVMEKERFDEGRRSAS
jgi:NAD(P)-dependent dehydrogenase (short-subunit alcohol dehydrogenase family)